MRRTYSRRGIVTLSCDNESLYDEMESKYLDEITADVYFVIGEKRIPAHKSLLASRSDVFKAMFYGELKEEGAIKIVDATADAFKDFLQFFYLREVELDIENIKDVMNLIQKYMITAAMHTCVQFLKRSIDTDDVCFILQLALHFCLRDLMIKCQVFIENEGIDVFETDGFLNCDRIVLGKILEFSYKNGSCPAIDVFRAVISWTEMRIKKKKITRAMVQKHLGELFYKIDFGSMKLTEFFAITSEYENLFSYEEYQDIVQTIALPDYKPKIFPVKKLTETSN